MASRNAFAAACRRASNWLTYATVRAGWVSRGVVAVVPAGVICELTARGRSLGAPLEELARWSVQHLAVD